MKVFFLLLFCVILSGLNAQEINAVRLKESSANILPGKKFKDAFYSVTFDWQGQSGFSAKLSRFVHSIELEKYDKHLNKIKTTKLSGGERVYGPVPPSIFVIKSNLYLFYYKLTGTEKLKLYCAQIDTATLQVSSELELLNIQTDEEKLKFYMRSPDNGDINQTIIRDYNYTNALGMTKTFFIEPSPDGSKFIVMWNSGFDKKIFYSVLDANLNKKRENIIDLKEQTEMRINNAMVDNNGNAYFSVNYEKGSDNKAMICIATVEGKNILKEIEPEGSSPFGIHTAFGADGKSVFICGAYKEGGRNLQGVYNQVLNITNFSLGKITKTPFPQDFVTISDKDGWGNEKGKKPGVFDNLFFKLYPLKNGTFSLVGDFKAKNDVQRNNTLISGNITYVNFYNSSVSFLRIPKSFATQYSVYTPATILAEHQDKVFLFYNDHIKNVNRDIKEKAYITYKEEDKVMVVAIINKDGSVSRKVVSESNTKQNYTAETEQFVSVSSNSFILPYSSVRQYGIGKLEHHFKWELITIN